MSNKIQLNAVEVKGEYVLFDNRLWTYEQPPMDDRGRLYLYYHHPINGTDDVECVEMVTLIPIYEVMPDDTFKLNGYSVDEYRYKDNGWHNGDIEALCGRIGR